MAKEFNLEKFTKWLKQGGVEILPNTNEYELVRFKGKQVGVIYKSGKYNTDYTGNALFCYKSGNSWNGAPISTKRKNYIKKKEQLLERDGDKCFYCNLELVEDITAEHLIELTQGGKNNLANMVLSHEKCNSDVQGFSVVEKVNLVIQNRMNYAR